MFTPQFLIAVNVEHLLKHWENDSIFLDRHVALITTVKLEKTSVRLTVE